VSAATAAGSTQPVLLWRIGADTPSYEAHELTGAGAERSGGRWNRVGTPMVYASTSRSLACLETVVHLARTPLPLNRYLVQIEVPRACWEAATTIVAAALVGWDAVPAGRASLDWAARWVASGHSALAIVPSVIVPEELNVLINPAHPQAASLRASKLRRWSYDPRLFSAGL
jgi:RES domain-containing protein